MQLADRIRQIRKAYKFSQTEIAFRADISPSAYGQIERKAANASFKTLSKISNSLDVSILFLIDIENPSFIEEKNKL